MVAINPLIIAGGRRSALPQMAQGQIMTSIYYYPVFVTRYGTLITPPAPFLHLLRPGPYSLNNHGFDPTLLGEYGLATEALNKIVLAGHMLLPQNIYLNFIITYDRNNSADTAQSAGYMEDYIYTRTLPLLPGNQGMAGVSLAPLYAMYCDNQFLNYDTLRTKEWSQYSSFILHFVYFEEN